MIDDCSSSPLKLSLYGVSHRAHDLIPFFFYFLVSSIASAIPEAWHAHVVDTCAKLIAGETHSSTLPPAVPFPSDYYNPLSPVSHYRPLEAIADKKSARVRALRGARRCAERRALLEARIGTLIRMISDESIGRSQLARDRSRAYMCGCAFCVLFIYSAVNLYFVDACNM